MASVIMSYKHVSLSFVLETTSKSALATNLVAGVGGLGLRGAIGLLGRHLEWFVVIETRVSELSVVAVVEGHKVATDEADRIRSFGDQMGAEIYGTDFVGRVEGTGLVYISSGGRSAISSSCGLAVLRVCLEQRTASIHLEPSARDAATPWSLHPSFLPSASEWSPEATVPGRGKVLARVCATAGLSPHKIEACEGT